MHPFTLPENAFVFGALKPAADAAGRTGRYFSVKNAHKIYFVFEVDQGNAATIQVDVLQATDASGTSAKAVSGNRRLWSDLDEATSDTIVRRTDAQTYTTDAAVKEKLIILEVNPDDMDIANSFLYVAPRTGASNAANLTSAVAYVVPRFQGAGQPSYTA